MQNDNLGFVPDGAPSAPQAGAPAATMTSQASQNDVGFVADGGSAAAPAAAAGKPAQRIGSAGQSLENTGPDILGAINNNPIGRGLVSLTALPVQGLAKLMGRPDPFAGGIGGGPGTGTAPVGVTSSDQPLGKFAEEEAGNAITVGSLFVPGGRAAEAAAPWLAPALGKFAPAAARIGVGTAMGALQGLGGGMQEGQSGAELKKSAGIGALIGGGLSTAGELGSALYQNMTANTTESRLFSQKERLKTLQTSFDDNSTFLKDPKTGKYALATDPISTLTDTGLAKKLSVVDGRVNTDAVDTGLQDLIAKQDAAAKPLVDNIPGTVSLKEFQKDVIDAVENNPQIRDAGKVNQALAEVDRRFSSFQRSFGGTFDADGNLIKSAEVPYKTINNIRVGMNREFDPEARDIARTIGDTARAWLYDAETGSPELKAVMGKQGELLKADAWLQKLRGTVVRGGRLGKYLADMTGSGIGATVGSAAGPVGTAVGAGVGGLVTDKAMNMYQNNYFNPLISKAASSLGSFVPTSALSTAGTIAKGALIPAAVQSKKD